MKKLLAVLLLVCLVLCAAGCADSGVMSQEKAEKIAIEALGFQEKDVTNVSVHPTTYEGKSCYGYHINVEGHNYEVIVDATTGDVLYKGDSTH